MGDGEVRLYKASVGYCKLKIEIEVFHELAIWCAMHNEGNTDMICCIYVCVCVELYEDVKREGNYIY